MMLDYVLVPLLSAVYVSITAARLLPSVPYAVWAFLFALFITLVNARGLQTTARASRVMARIMVGATVLFVGGAIQYIVRTAGVTGLWVPTAIFNPETFSLPSLMLGGGSATLSCLGFDAVSTLAKDARHPAKDIGFAAILVCMIQTAFCLLIVYLGAVA